MSDPKNKEEKAINNSGVSINASYKLGLFVKFFFWFWLAVVSTGILVATYGYFYHFKPESKRMFTMGRELLEENGRMVVDAYETSGIELALSVRLPGSFWLYDEQLNSIFSPQNTRNSKLKHFSRRHERFIQLFEDKEPVVKEIARKLLAGKNSESEEIAGEMLIGSVLTSETNKKYVLISHLPQKMPKPERFLVENLLESMPFFLLITALFCYALSRYMVSPISELRHASRDFAGGNLDARVTGNAVARFDEIGDLAVDFNDMAEKIEQMIRGQRRLFGDISHELRSPLARLQVAVELLQKRLPAAEQPMLARIENEVARINSLIGEVLAFSRLEAGNLNGERQQVSLLDTLSRICNDANFEGKTHNREVILKAAEDIKLSGIEQLLERAIENILRNALKYSPDNSQIEVELSVKNNQAVISIGDHGPGVHEAELNKLFAPFYRCSEDRNRSSGGTGLGLAIALRAIKLHNGDITLKNREGGGLIAEILLPLN
ncbi:MAG: Sensor protein [uncultured bacterium]|nr:MAG: Sensor protein [uncultured bacterium]